MSHVYLLRGSIENVQDIYAERAALLLKEDKEKVHICSWLWVARNLMIKVFWFFSSIVLQSFVLQPPNFSIQSQSFKGKGRSFTVE